MAARKPTPAAEATGTEDAEAKAAADAAAEAKAAEEAAADEAASKAAEEAAAAEAKAAEEATAEAEAKAKAAAEAAAQETEGDEDEDLLRSIYLATAVHVQVDDRYHAFPAGTRIGDVVNGVEFSEELAGTVTNRKAWVVPTQDD
ncbi:MAG TPA: hypothetical protein VIP28_13115 [Nocardioides sp.]